MHPLSKDRITELLILEDLFFKGTLSRPKVESLLEIYRVCAEYYDAIKDPITVYFSEKIQYTVSQKAVLALLTKPQANTGAGDEAKAAEKTKEEDSQGSKPKTVAKDSANRREVKSNH